MESARKILEFVKPGGDVELSQNTEKEINLSKLINRLNFVNFQDQTILVNFRHPKYARTFSMNATPLPCADNKLECRWTDPDEFKTVFKTCSFENILIDNGQRLVLAVPELLSVGETGAAFLLPEKSFEMNYRKTRRHNCEGVDVELLQNGARFHGTLVDFSAVSFRIATESPETQTFNWINMDAPVQIIFSRDSRTLYSGQCRILSHNLGRKTRYYVLEPVQDHMQRFKTKEVRSTRIELLPLPNALFRHPLTGKIVDLKVIDVSGSGFSVREEAELSVMLPGMIIPDLELTIANGFTTKCLAQVIYRQTRTEEDGTVAVKCGLTFLDMEIRDHVSLLSLLSLAKNKHSYMNNRVNTDDLWQFFFETGFIYPAKYAFVQANKHALKEMYEKLYTGNPSVARHFIYQERGSILGHMAMLRFYDKSWLVHHHAANKSESNTAGVVVLNQLTQSINDSYNLQSAHMSYILCYYRPENKFPNRVFGGFVKSLGNRKGCSIDTFAYLHYRRDYEEEERLGRGWELEASTAEDLMELESFYEQESGGLMLNALHLLPDTMESEALSEEYRKLGFNMQRHCYTLKNDGNVKAIITVNISDLGLNLSDLTNCIHVIVVDQEELPKEKIELMLSILTRKHDQTDLPVLVYPVPYADSVEMKYEKRYSLWALNAADDVPRFAKFLGQLVGRKRRPRANETAEVAETAEPAEQEAKVAQHE